MIVRDRKKKSAILLQLCLLLLAVIILWSSAILLLTLRLLPTPSSKLWMLVPLFSPNHLKTHTHTRRRGRKKLWGWEKLRGKKGPGWSKHEDISFFLFSPTHQPSSFSASLLISFRALILYSSSHSPHIYLSPLEWVGEAHCQHSSLMLALESPHLPPCTAPLFNLWIRPLGSLA